MTNLAFSMKDAAKSTGLSRRLLYHYLNAGLLKTVTVGGRRLVMSDELDRFLRSNPPQLDYGKAKTKRRGAR